MDTTLQVLKENALKAYETANDGGKTLLSNLFGKDVFARKITERVTTFEDILRLSDITEREFEIKHSGKSADAYAYEKLKLLVKVLNEGWEPDWENESEYKYEIIFKLKGGFSFRGVDYLCGLSAVGSRLCFKSRELAEYAAKQFLLIYKAFLTK